jgi:hypothetical protein
MWIKNSSNNRVFQQPANFNFDNSHLDLHSSCPPSASFFDAFAWTQNFLRYRAFISEMDRKYVDVSSALDSEDYLPLRNSLDEGTLLLKYTAAHKFVEMFVS